MSATERRCPNCGALVAADAEWCGQCFVSLRELDSQRPAAAPTSSATAEASPAGSVDASKVATDRSLPTWPCPTCGHENVIDLDVCLICGTSFAALMRTDEKPPPIEPAKALRRSLIFPGLGHSLAGHGTDGIARGLLFAMLIVMALIVGLSGISSGVLLTVFTLFAGMAAVIYLGSAWEAYRLANGEALFVSSRVVLWATVGIVMVSVALLALAATTATKR
ncbi:MAG: hypothetical protein M3P11_09100 [Actinomycetota bacterium]|nr:hypothetical protein [Actinomycetota bacterium]